MNKKLTTYIFVFILLLILIFPMISLASSEEKGKEEKTKDVEDGIGKYYYFIGVALSVSFAMAIAAFGAAFAQAKTAKAALEGVARQPEAAGKIQMQMILALVFIETLAIYTLVIALLLIFVNPFTKYIA